MTAQELTAYVGAQQGQAAFVSTCWAEATALVTGFCGTRLPMVPLEILRRATLNVGSELYHQKSAPNGVAQFAAADGSPVRVARDPMVSAYPLLRPFVGIGIG